MSDDATRNILTILAQQTTALEAQAAALHDVASSIRALIGTDTGALLKSVLQVEVHGEIRTRAS